MEKGGLKKLLWSIIAASGILGMIAKSVFDKITKDAGFFDWIKSSIFAFLSIHIPLWTAIAGVFALFVFMVIIVNLHDKLKEYQWSNYTKDDYCNWTFRWWYSEVSNASIGGIYPICKQCNCELSIKYDDYFEIERCLYCPSCNGTYPLLNKNIISDFKKVIISRIQNGVYNKEGYVNE